MKEFKPPRKSFIYYYVIAMLVIMLLNIFVFPKIIGPKVQEVPYNTFLQMLDRGEISEASKDAVMITIADKAKPPKLYKTGLMEDPGLVARMEKAQIQFYAPIVEPASPLMSFLPSWLLPIGFFILIGRLMSNRLPGWKRAARRLPTDKTSR